MAYPYPQYYPGQPYQYQDQLNQLRNTPQPMQYQPQRQETGLNWVQGEAGAKSWFITPGSTVLLMDSEAQRFYLKSADPSGIPSMRTFEYTEITGAQLPVMQTAPQAVTREEFDRLAQIVAQLQNKEVNGDG
jgi:hypothetical protein